MVTTKFLHAEDQVLSASHHGSIKLWDCAKLTYSNSIDAGGQLYDVDVDSHDVTLVAGMKDCVKVFDLRDPKETMNFSGIHTRPVNCVQYSFDKNQLITASGDSTIKIWDVRTQKLLTKYQHANI